MVALLKGILVVMAGTVVFATPLAFALAQLLIKGTSQMERRTRTSMAPTASSDGH